MQYGDLNVVENVEDKLDREELIKSKSKIVLLGTIRMIYCLSSHEGSEKISKR